MVSERPEHPLRMAKELGLVLLESKNKSYRTMSYDDLLDLAEKAFYRNRYQRKAAS